MTLQHHAAHVHALDVLQRMLARWYGLEPEGSLAPYLVDEPTLHQLAQTGAVHPRPGAREEVFVLQEGEDVSIGLWLDEQALEAASDAVEQTDHLALNAGRFADFCVALEGVSHLVLMEHRAQLGLPVTQLELEMQAEVDKYMAARLTPWHHVVSLTPHGEEPRVTAAVMADLDAPPPADLEEALFDQWHPAAHLQDEQVERYRTASRYAHRYCRHLEKRFLTHRRTEALGREMRAFFRMGQAQRVQHISGT